MPTHNIALTAALNPADRKEINVTGNGGGNLPRGSGPHQFEFTLDDRTGHAVSFALLKAADNCSVCPPVAGQPNTQIVNVVINNNPPSGRPRTAEFTDKNDNKPRMDVSYEWTFTCDDQSIRVLPFDPIISNGGRN